MAPECNPGMELNDRPDDASLASLYQAYLDARYRWGVGGRWRPVVIGKPLPELEAQFPLARWFGMVSAWNPLSVERPDRVNRAEDERLHAAIRARGWQGVPGFASAPDRTWREPNWVVIDIAPAEMDALAREFGQLGTLQWSRGQAVRLCMHAAKPAPVAPHPHVDWIQ